MADTFTCLLILNVIACMPTSNAWVFRRRNRARTSCYTHPINVGCFPMSAPHDNTKGIGPQSPTDLEATFYLVRPGQGPLSFNVLNAQRRLRGVYNPTVKTAVMIHGYLESCSTHWLGSLAYELNAREAMNIICLDWEEGARHIHSYALSAANTRMVGALLAMVLGTLVDLGGNPSMFHLIGYSLGAHAAGHAGKLFPNVGRITGLDPAGPFFDGVDHRARLSRNDATLVDVWHTDLPKMLNIGFGASQRMGDLDFYVNGGYNQPGCPSNLLDRLMSASVDLMNSRMPGAFHCSHGRAHSLFISTVRGSCQFPTLRCPHSPSQYRCQRCNSVTNPCPNMGYNLTGLSPFHLGEAYVTTTSASHPFC